MGAASSLPDSAFPIEESPSHWLQRRHGRVSACAEDEDAAAPPVRRITRVRSLSLEPEPRPWAEQEPESPLPASEGSPSPDCQRHRRGGSWGGKLTPRLSLPFRPRKKAAASPTGSPGAADAKCSSVQSVPSLRAAASLPKDFKVQQEWLCVAPPQTLSPPQTPPGTASALQERVTSRLRRTSPLSLSSLPGPEESSTSSLPGLVLPSASGSSFSSSSGLSGFSASSTPSSTSSPSSQSSGFTSPSDTLSSRESENFSAESSESPHYVTQMYMVKKDADADADVSRPSSADSDSAWISGEAYSDAEMSEDGHCMDDELEDMSFYHQQLQLYHVRFPAGVDRSANFKWQPKLESIIEFDVGKQGLAQVLARRRSLGSADMREVMKAVEEVAKEADREALPPLLRLQHR